MKYTALIPHRTVATLLLILFSSPVLILHFGLGLSSMVPMMIGITVGLTLLLLPIGTLKGNNTKRLIVTARTLLALLAVFYINIGYISGGGIGAMIARSFQLFDFRYFWQAMLLTSTVTLVIDIATGFAQVLLIQKTSYPTDADQPRRK